ncbi:GntR family transcriptional regulator [Singulisphaera sp. PoT]|uniref:GntR family transcriptional regulator n=1 Tax=Singulisphaera sp. PoT TaxID=3411797 RepID=UPI003BF4958C
MPMDNERNCMSDRIRRELAARIIDGRLKPGERLIELAIAREFDTSQTPVREALRELESSRLVESVPYRGTRVREVGAEEMAEAYAVRAALEQMAAELAAARLGGDVSDLRRSLAGLHKAAKGRDREGYARHDLDLHRGILEASGNRVLLQVWESLAFETRVRLTLARGGLDLVAEARKHDAIIDALEAGDGKAAGLLLRKHSESFIGLDLDQRPPGEG